MYGSRAILFHNAAMYRTSMDSLQIAVLFRVSSQLSNYCLPAIDYNTESLDDIDSNTESLDSNLESLHWLKFIGSGHPTLLPLTGKSMISRREVSGYAFIGVWCELNCLHRRLG